MHPILFEIFGIKVQAFGVMVFAGFLAGYLYLQLKGPRQGLEKEAILSLFVWILISGIAGARLLYVLIHWHTVKDHPLEILMIWRGGVVLYGGVLTGLAAAYLFARRNKIRFLDLADVMAPAALVGIFFGRFGCFLVGDCYGKPADLPWSVRFPYKEGSLIPPDLLYVPLHPTQIYSAFNALFLFFITLYIAGQRRFAGQVFLAGLVLYGLTRGGLEFFRGDRDARGFLGPLSTSQWISLGLLAGAGILYLILRDRERKEKNGERR